MDAKELNKHTIEDLRDMCGIRGLKADGDKESVIKRIIEHEKKVNQSGKSHHKPPPSNSHSDVHLHHFMDLEKESKENIQIPDCASCKNPIKGQIIVAIGHSWHPEHFLCMHCKKALITTSFFEHNGRPYCEKDYRMLFSPRCAGCKELITSKCVTAMGKSFHPDHFVCAECGIIISEKTFHAKDGKAYCSPDYNALFAPKCAGCHDDIVGTYISALQKQWHQKCFLCNEPKCQLPLEGHRFFEHDNLPFCEQHFAEKTGFLCAGCNSPIYGRYITALHRKFHLEHFVCAQCNIDLHQGAFKDRNEKPYCLPCYSKF